MVSIIIPSRSPQWLRKTVSDLYNQARGPIEVIVVYDGRWPEVNELPIDNPTLIQIHHGLMHENYGMRASINLGVKASKGDYIMVIDEQCGVGAGFDKILAEDCEDDWVVIPRRKRLEPEDWSIIKDGRPDIDYMHIDYPYQRPHDKTCGLHGAEWKQRAKDRKDILIDDTPTMQGSCYFMSRKHWDRVIVQLDETNYGTFTQEAQEVGNKTWFSGGRVVVNKKTWYAHWHKGSKGKGYGFSNAQYKRHLEDMEKGRLYCINYWLNTKDFKYDWDWFMKKFPDMPGWDDDWKERLVKDAPQDFSATYAKEGYKPSW